MSISVTPSSKTSAKRTSNLWQICYAARWI